MAYATEMRAMKPMLTFSTCEELDHFRLTFPDRLIDSEIVQTETMSTVEAFDGNPEKRSGLYMDRIRREMESLGSHLDCSHRHLRAIDVSGYRLRHPG